MSKNNEINRPKFTGPLAGFPWQLAQKLAYEDLKFEHDLKVELKQIRKNKDIIVAGKHYEALFVNHDGWLFRYKILHNGDRQILDFILPGQIFGLQACLFKTSLYSVATITEASLSSIPLDCINL